MPASVRLKGVAQAKIGSKLKHQADKAQVHEMTLLAQGNEDIGSQQVLRRKS